MSCMRKPPRQRNVASALSGGVGKTRAKSGTGAVVGPVDGSTASAMEAKTTTTTTTNDNASGIAITRGSEFMCWLFRGEQALCVARTNFRRNVGGERRFSELEHRRLGIVERGVGAEDDPLRRHVAQQRGDAAGGFEGRDVEGDLRRLGEQRRRAGTRAADRV